MSAKANHFVGLWQGERRAGFANIIMNLESEAATKSDH
jgi:hypothetical protein